MCTTAVFFFGGADSWSKPLASRFLRLSRLFRFDFASCCIDALLGGAGEDPVFRSSPAPLNGVPPGGMTGELTSDEGAEEPAGCPDAIILQDSQLINLPVTEQCGFHRSGPLNDQMI